MRMPLAVLAVATTSCGSSQATFKPATLPDLAPIQSAPTRPLSVQALVLPSGEQLIWDVHMQGMTIGRAELDIGDTEVRSRFKTDSLASMVMVVRHELTTIVDRPSARAGAASEVLEVNSKSKHFELPPSGNVGQTMHTALGLLRAWAQPNAQAGYIVVAAMGKQYRLDVMRPIVEDMEGKKTLHVTGKIKTDEPIDIGLWFANNAERTPVRIELADEDFHLTADLVQ